MTLLRALVLDENTTKSISTLKEFAEKNPFAWTEILAMMDGQAKAAGDREGYSVIIPDGYRVVYSIEQQPAGNVRHLSVSVDDPKALPSEIAVDTIASLLGFPTPTVSENQVFIEGEDGAHQSINVLNFI